MTVKRSLEALQMVQMDLDALSPLDKVSQEGKQVIPVGHGPQKAPRALPATHL